MFYVQFYASVYNNSKMSACDTLEARYLPVKLYWSREAAPPEPSTAVNE
jgi:hypothetical protein